MTLKNRIRNKDIAFGAIGLGNIGLPPGSGSRKGGISPSAPMHVCPSVPYVPGEAAVAGSPIPYTLYPGWEEAAGKSLLTLFIIACT